MKIYKSSLVAVLPVILWNIFLYSKLPDAYQEGKGWEVFPQLLDYTEMGFRIITFVTLFYLIIEIKSKFQKVGLITYLIGIVVYFSSWLAQIFVPESNWSQSPLGFSAPAWTPIIWLMGIGIMSKVRTKKVNFLIPTYIISSVLFVLVHSFHALIVYYKLK